MKCKNCISKVDIKTWDGTAFTNGIKDIIKSENMIIDKENCSCSNPLSEFYNCGININNICNLYKSK